MKVCQAGKRSFPCCWERSSSDEKMPSFAAIAQICDVGQVPGAVLRWLCHLQADNNAHPSQAARTKFHFGYSSVQKKCVWHFTDSFQVYHGIISRDFQLPEGSSCSSQMHWAPVVQGGAINSKCPKRWKQEVRAEDGRFGLPSAKPSVLYEIHAI